MTREELRKILGNDVESEVINQILDTLHAEIDVKVKEVEDKYKDLQTNLDNAQTDLKTANSTIRKLQKENPDIEDLQKQIQTYQDKYKELEQQREADRQERDAEFINSAIENDLIKHQVLDVKSAMVHYDKSKIKIGKDRTLTGIEDQTASILKDKPFLFGKPEPAKKPQQDYSPQEGKASKPSFGAQLAQQHIKEMEAQKEAVEQAFKTNF